VLFGLAFALQEMFSTKVLMVWHPPCARHWPAKQHDELSVGARGAEGGGIVLRLWAMICRWKTCAALLRAVVALLLLPIFSQAQVLSPSAVTTQTLQANIVPLGGLFTVTSALPLTKTSATFNGFTGAMTLSYRARTSQFTGQATITVKATADFAPAGGPSIANPPSAGDKFTYTCGGATLGTSCSGTQTVSTTSATNVVSIGASACTGGGAPCSTANPNSANVTFTLTNDTKYKTGSYSATLTWTISAS